MRISTSAPASANNAGSVQFKWAILRGGSWVGLTDYGSASSYSYTPTKPGNYRIGVFVRNVGSRAYQDSESVTLKAQP